MRLLLDHHFSGRRIGAPLRAAGHDVRALQDEPELAGMRDPDVLALAATETRIVVTRNSRDFAPLAREWAELGHHHAGIMLVWSFDHSESSAILDGVERRLALYPTQDEWQDLVIVV